MECQLYCHQADCYKWRDSVRFIIILLLKGGDYILRCSCGSQTQRQAAAVIECMNGIAINSHQIKMYVGTTTHSTETDRTQGRIGYRTGPLAWLKNILCCRNVALSRRVGG